MPRQSISSKAWMALRTQGPGIPFNIDEARWLVRQGLAGFVYSHSRDQEAQNYPDEFEQAFKAQLSYNMWLTHCLGQLEALSEYLILLKGISLIDRIHHPGERPMEDIDVLVAPEHWLKVHDFLLDQGFVLIPEKRWQYNKFKRVYRRGEAGLLVDVELHSRLFENEPEDFSWALAENRHLGFRVMQPEFELAHLLGHYGFQHSFLSPKWLVDIDRYIRFMHEELDWQKLLALITRLRQRKSAAIGLWAASKLLLTPVPQFIFDNLPNPSGFFARRVFQGRFLIAPGETSFQYYMAKHMAKDSLFETFRYDSLWLLHWLWSRRA